MILIRGECGSGKSAALRALEASPPAGFRAVYVPVPTLDFSGIARWCLDRLGIAPQQDPALALHAAAQRERLALLIDDADLLPLDAALAVRHLEREAAGNLLVVAAVSSDVPANEPIIALGPPARAIEVLPGRSDEVAAAVRDALAPAAEREASARVRKAARPARALPLSDVRSPASPERKVPTRPIAPLPVDAAVPDAIAASRVQVAPAGRSVPLSIALAMACAAFLIPVAFGAGYWIGAQPALSAAEPAMPSVSAPPPAMSAAAPEPLEARERPSAAPRSEIAPRSAVASASSPEPAQRLAASRTPLEAPAPAAVRSVPPKAQARTAPTAILRADPREPEPVADRREDAGWDVPVLISVEPGSDGP